VKPGKPTVLAAVGAKPVVGLPGNPTSAVIILQAVAAPIFAALAGAMRPVDRVPAKLAEAARSRKGWTWYIPVELKQEGGGWTAHPLPLRSSTVSVISRAEGFIALPEAIEEYSGQTIVIVERFL
jgi:molybdopterin biosynthesis enzyme